MGGIRTNAAAELLGVSPSTLRSWERRLGYPRPRRTNGNHRQYDLEQLESLREALGETGNISSAVEIAQRRGKGLPSPARLLAAFDRFDEAAANRELEESFAVRSHTQALELALRRAGLRVLVLSVGLAQDRFARAIRALRPSALVLCGSGASLEVTGAPLRRALAGADGARLFGYREARLVSGRNGIPQLGSLPGEATASLLTALGAAGNGSA